MTHLSISKSNRGAVSEARFVMVACLNNWDVAKPIHESHGYDFVIRRYEKWETVQVKTVTEVHDRRGFNRTPQYAVKLTRNCMGVTRRYEAGEFDWLCAVYQDEVWLIPFHAIAGKANLSIRAAAYEPFKVA